MYVAYIALSSFFALALTLISTLRTERLVISIIWFSVAMLCVFYFLAMWRTSGVDFDNYVQYHEDPTLIPDIGYMAIAHVSSSIGIGFTPFLLIQAVFTAYCVYCYSRRLAAPFLISFGIFVSHSAIVRDFSQSRVGLAVALVFLAYSQRSRLWKCVLLLMACSVHLSVLACAVAFLFVDYLATWRRGRLLTFLAISGALMLFVGGNLIQLLSVIDPRIELYLKWDEALYGAPVGNYSQLAFYLLLLGISLYAYRVTQHELLLRFILLTYFAVLLFVAFSDVAIFAYRVSHLLTVFYPFVFSKILSYRLLPGHGGMKSDVYADPSSIKVLSVAISVAVLLISTRPSNADVLNEIVSGLHF